MVATCIVRDVKRQEIRSTFLGPYVAGGKDKASWAMISSAQGSEIGTGAHIRSGTHPVFRPAVVPEVLRRDRSA